MGLVTLSGVEKKTFEPAIWSLQVQYVTDCDLLYNKARC